MAPTYLATLGVVGMADEERLIGEPLRALPGRQYGRLGLRFETLAGAPVAQDATLPAGVMGGMAEGGLVLGAVVLPRLGAHSCTFVAVYLVG